MRLGSVGVGGLEGLGGRWLEGVEDPHMGPKNRPYGDVGTLKSVLQGIQGMEDPHMGPWELPPPPPVCSIWGSTTSPPSPPIVPLSGSRAVWELISTSSSTPKAWGGGHTWGR